VSTVIGRFSESNSIDINNSFISLEPIGLKNWVLLTWYTDASAEDEYGCQGLNNNFHIWLINIDDVVRLNPSPGSDFPHVTLIPGECSKRWIWGSKIAFRHKGSRYVAFGGGIFVGSNKINPQILVYNVDDPENPVKVVDLVNGDETYQSTYQIVYLKGYIYGARGGKLFKVPFDELMSMSSFAQIETTNISASRAIGLNDKYILVNSVEVFDADTLEKIAQVTLPGTRNATYPLVIDRYLVYLVSTVEGKLDKAVVLDLKSLEQFEMQVDPQPVIPDPVWGWFSTPIGNQILYNACSALYMMTFDVESGVVAVEQLLSDFNVPGMGQTVPVYDGKLVVVGKGGHCAHSDGTIRLVELSDVVRFKYEGDGRVCAYLGDEPLRHVTVRIEEVLVASNEIEVRRKVAEKETDDNGCIRLATEEPVRLYVKPGVVV